MKIVQRQESYSTDQPIFDIYVGFDTKSVTNPHVVLYSKTNYEILDGPEVEEKNFPIWKEVRFGAERRIKAQEGKHVILKGTFEAGPQNGVAGFTGTPRFELVHIATIVLKGNTSRTWDGFLFAEVAVCGLPTMKWLGIYFGNVTFADIPDPNPWPPIG